MFPAPYPLIDEMYAEVQDQHRRRQLAAARRRAARGGGRRLSRGLRDRRAWLFVRLARPRPDTGSGNPPRVSDV